VGLAAGKWCPYGLDADQPGDQRDEAGGSLLFDTAPLDQPLDILGAPALHLDVASDRLNAFVAATLSEVFPDGAATRLTYGILNLTHRDGHEDLKSLEPGGRYNVRLQMNECGQRIGAGNRLRLAISTAYWPIVWPSPEPVTLTIATGASSLELPVRPPRAEDEELRPFEPAENAPALRRMIVRTGDSRIEVRRDLRTGRVETERYTDDGLVRIEDFGWEYGASARRVYSIHPDDPLSPEVRIHWRKEFGRDGFHVHIDAHTQMQATRTEFLIIGKLDAYEGDEQVFSREWTCRIPRDHV
ncbi:MAG: peptidase S15, partial [Rhizobiales bacterium]|nr:peptidase S15 [Hyphomicrobiales bacterium]